MAPILVALDPLHCHLSINRVGWCRSLRGISGRHHYSDIRRTPMDGSRTGLRSAARSLRRHGPFSRGISHRAGPTWVQPARVRRVSRDLLHRPKIRRCNATTFPIPRWSPCRTNSICSIPRWPPLAFIVRGANWSRQARTGRHR